VIIILSLGEGKKRKKRGEKGKKELMADSFEISHPPYSIKEGKKRGERREKGGGGRGQITERKISGVARVFFLYSMLKKEEKKEKRKKGEGDDVMMGTDTRPFVAVKSLPLSHHNRRKRGKRRKKGEKKRFFWKKEREKKEKKGGGRESRGKKPEKRSQFPQPMHYISYSEKEKEGGEKKGRT